MEDCGFLPGRMKLLGEGGRPYLRRAHDAQRGREALKTGADEEVCCTPQHGCAKSRGVEGGRLAVCVSWALLWLHSGVQGLWRTRSPGQGWRNHPSDC